MRSFGRVLAVMVSLGSMLGCDGVGAAPSQPSAVEATPVPVRATLTVAEERELAAVDVRFAPRSDEGGVIFAAPSEPARTLASFGQGGARISLESGHATIRGTAIGRAGRMRAMAEAPPSTSGPEVQMDRDGVTEWWRSLPSGLEHGFTIAARPEGTDALVIESRFDGVTTHDRSEGVIDVLGADGFLFATYSQLSVLDATGASLDARMHASAEGVRIEIEDAAAVYPLVVDPMFLIATEQSLGACGGRVSMTPTGSRVATGTAIYNRSGTTWTLDATLTNPGAGTLGNSASISDDGSHVLVGSTGGAVYLFTRAGAGSWTLDHTFSTGTVTGSAVGGALSGDGTRAVIWNTANVTVYNLSGTTWSSIGGVAGIYGGGYMDMSSDGSRFIAHPSSNTRVYVYGGGSAWNVEGTLDTQTTGPVDITPDGTRAATPSGIYVRSGSTWTAEYTGAAWALDSGGTRAICGPSSSSRNLCLRTGSTWTIDAPVSASGQFSFDGTRAAVCSGTSATVYRFDSAHATGTACTSTSECLTGFCEDGFCCNSRCNGTCEGCSMARTGVANGTCAPFTAAVAATVTCRAASSVCDVLERCAAGTNVCPTDRFAPNTTSCHTHTVGGCDADASCTGSSATCPSPPSAAGLPCHTATPGACDADASCNGTTLTCPDTHAPSTTVCRAPIDLCDAPEYCTGTNDTCTAPDMRQAMGYTCRPSQGGCDIPEYCPGGAALCPTDVVLPMNAPCNTGMTGGSCSLGGMCNGTSASCSTGGFQPNGHVCNPRDPANPCDVDDVCNGSDDICRPSYAPASTSCVATAMSGACDAADHCSGSSSACVDAVQPSGTMCRAAVAGGCDVPESCDGTSHACPMDVVQPNGVICRDYAGICDQQEVCDGMSNTCPIDVRQPATFECRPSAGACDRAERCDGFGVGCPLDALLAAGAACGSAGAACVTGGTCNGSAPECQGGTLRPMNTVCHLHDPANPCELDSVCNGVDDVCAPRFAPDTTQCGPPISGVCDVLDHCSGTSADCVATYATGVVCRAAAGACDAPESCSGSAAACPPDNVEAAGMVCRAASSSCDVAEMCDGTVNSCPADEMACDGGVVPTDGGVVTDGGVPAADTGPLQDGGGDGGAPNDASSMGDGGAGPPVAGSCACSVTSPRERGEPGLLALGIVLALLVRRRQRA